MTELTCFTLVSFTAVLVVLLHFHHIDYMSNFSNCPVLFLTSAV
jgi:hypothetical protein